jgi:zinc protease
MKKLSVLFFLLPLAIFAQVDRTIAPKPGPAPKIKVAQPPMFTLPNGLKVFVVSNTKLPRVSANLTLDIDAVLEGSKAGISEIAGSLISKGSKTKSKEVLDEEVDFLGAELGTSATNASINSLTSNFDKAFSLMADVVLNPALKNEEFEKIRKQTLSGLETQKDEPEAIKEKVMSKLMYGANHPYGEAASSESVAKIGLEDVKKFYNTYWKPNVAYLVFVGDITQVQAQAMATKYFGKWQRGIVPKATYTMPTPTGKTYIAVVDRPASVQSIIAFGTPIQLKPGTQDVISSRVMNNILGESATARLFMNLREKHGFTYGAYSHVNEDKLVGNFSADASVRNEKTDSAIAEFIFEFNRIRKEAVTKGAVDTIKNLLSGSFARSLESPSTVARFALNTARYAMPKDYYQNYLTNLASVNSAMVQQMANKYVMPANMHIVIVGNAKEIAKGLDKYGEVKYYDIEGKPTVAPNEGKAVDASITGESIVKKYIAAIGGDAAIAAVKDASMTGIAKIPGAPMDFTMTQKYWLPKYYKMSMGAGPMVVQSQSKKDGVYEKIEQGKVAELEEKDKEELDEEAGFINEKVYINNKYTMVVKGIETVDGKDVYVLQVTSSKGRNFTNYYDVATGLKTKTATKVDDGQGGKMMITTYFDEYKSYNSIQIPTKVTLDVGVKISIALTDIKINSGLTAEDFK